MHYQQGEIIRVMNIGGEITEHIILNEGQDFLYTNKGTVDFDQVIETVRKMPIEEFYTVREKEILKDIPQEFHSALSSKAYEDGHAYGYSEVLSKLEDLADMLKKPLKEFQKRIIEENR